MRKAILLILLTAATTRPGFGEEGYVDFSYSGDELCTHDLLTVLKQYTDLLQSWRSRSQGPPVRGHITVTGGEPFVREDFMDLLDTFSGKRDLFSFAILTNGTFIDADMARRLSRLKPAFVQI
jgi:hypothetical protein